VWYKIRISVVTSVFKETCKTQVASYGESAGIERIRLDALRYFTSKHRDGCYADCNLKRASEFFPVEEKRDASGGRTKGQYRTQVKFRPTARPHIRREATERGIRFGER